MITLNNGVSMPRLGFGVFQIPPAETAKAVSTALETGYRSIDTAKVYGNEREVGEALASAGLPRDEVFVTTKLWNDDQGYDSTLAAFDASMQRLGLDRLDLYLIHWPTPARDRYLDTWRALEKLHADGRIRAVGVSNFQPAHLTRVIDETGLVPAVNQIELHPALQQAELRAFHDQHGIVTEAWSPLAQGDVLDDPVITDIAGRYGKTPAQVVLRWHLDLGNVVIPKSVTPSRIRENFDLSDFSLTEEDMTRIAGLEKGTRIGPDPDEFN
ncbi:aldo/keto reductase [Streptosporangium sp. NPDC050855]|uniref:aldo/keto reductase n=1 Tax=Streptosporangium sp. NPDC050855 TaxID=3366194 RepID=UPI0037A4D40E